MRLIKRLAVPVVLSLSMVTAGVFAMTQTAAAAQHRNTGICDLPVPSGGCDVIRIDWTLRMLHADATHPRKRVVATVTYHVDAIPRRVTDNLVLQYYTPNTRTWHNTATVSWGKTDVTDAGVGHDFTRKMTYHGCLSFRWRFRSRHKWVSSTGEVHDWHIKLTPDKRGKFINCNL